MACAAPAEMGVSLDDNLASSSHTSHDILNHALQCFIKDNIRKDLRGLAPVASGMPRLCAHTKASFAVTGCGTKEMDR